METDGVQEEGKKWMVYYDGYCKLCSSTVQWILRNDRNRRFVYLPLQNLEEPPPEDNTVILARGDRHYYRSTAVLRIAWGLRFPWPLLGVFFLIPRFIRDAIYRLVARNRKEWFGTRTSCFLP